MPHIDGNIFIAAGLLAAFGIAGTGLVAFTHESTAQRIAQNERDALLSKIEKILPSGSADNDLLADSLTVRAPEYLGADQTTIYRGSLAGEPTVVVFSAVARFGDLPKLLGAWGGRE